MYGEPTFALDAVSRVVLVRFTPAGGAEQVVGYQIYDADGGMFLQEGEWQRVRGGEAVDLRVELPPERGHYHVFVSPIDEATGWAYQLGKPFLLIDAEVQGGQATLIRSGETTLARQRLRRFFSNVGLAFTLPLISMRTNRGLIRSMVRRDVLARYRGSFGDVLWTILNPLLLMATYFFVFGIVLQSRFGPDNSKTGFALYFLTGMLPWLAFSEAAGRAPHVLIEHRNFIKKLVFPVEILPVTQTLAALVTQAFAMGVFLCGLVAIRHGIPVTALWLPVLLIPQIMFTMGAAWFLSALGVFMRDLSQIMGFVLTLWFFLTPICYPEASLPPSVAGLLTKNPVYVLVRGYRAIFLEGTAPEFHSLWKLWLVAAVVFVLGYAWFHKLRKSFADVI